MEKVVSCRTDTGLSSVSVTLCTPSQPVSQIYILIPLSILYLDFSAVLPIKLSNEKYLREFFKFRIYSTAVCNVKLSDLVKETV